MLSVIIHIQNQEKRLKQCLENIKDWADEIVVVDDFSTDNSREIAKEYGCHVYTLRTDNFSEKDNFAKDKCKNEWVFLMDVDEHLTREVKEEMRRVIRSKPEENLFYVKRREHFMGHYLFSQRQARLFRRDKITWENAIHEIPIFEGKPGYIRKGYYEHFLPQDLSARFDKLNCYSDLDVVDLIAKKKRFSRPRLLFLMIYKPLQAFFGLYLFYGCLRRGILGLVFSLQYAFYKLLIYTKYYGKVYIQVDE